MTDRPDSERLVDLLADHDAGLPVDPRVLAEPGARTVLDALTATRTELAAVARVPVPPELAGRWSAAIATASAARGDDSNMPSSPVGHIGRDGTDRPPPAPDDDTAPDQRPDPVPGPGTATSPGPSPAPTSPVHGRPGLSGTASDPVRHTSRTDRPTGRPRSGPHRAGPDHPGPGRLRRPRPAVVAGLVLVVVLVVAGLISMRPAPPSVTAAQLGGVARAALGVPDAGPFTDPGRRAECLRAVAPTGLAPDAPLAGGRAVVLEGRPGVILLLITGELGVFRVIVVDPGCGADGGTLLADTLVGR